jgi:hypothetical protein
MNTYRWCLRREGRYIGWSRVVKSFGAASLPSRKDGNKLYLYTIELGACGGRCCGIFWYWHDGICLWWFKSITWGSQWLFRVGNLGFFRSDLVIFFSSYSSLSIVSIHLHTLLFVNTVNISCSCRSLKMIALSNMLFYMFNCTMLYSLWG